MQTQDLEASINAFLAYPTRSCLLLVSPDTAHLASVVGKLADVLAVGKTLSAALLHEAPAKWATTAERWLDQAVRQSAPGPLLVSGIDVLFDPSMRLNPLRLFCQVGRHTPLIVAWPGTYVQDVLAYAIPDHAHYRIWKHPDVIIKEILKIM
jgi:hypothetical protein